MKKHKPDRPFTSWATAILLVASTLPALAATPPSGCAVCTVSNNEGGIVRDFEVAGSSFHANPHRMLVIDGYCNSACMTMADRARPHVCITPNATFGYHRTNYGRPIPLSRDLRRWAAAHGGFPKYGTGMNMMPNEAARQFFPLCGQTIVHHGGGGSHL